MTKPLLPSLLLIGIIAASCGESAPEAVEDAIEQADASGTESETDEAEPAKTPKDFIPEGFVLFSETKGDLNKDGKEDLVLVIKATDKSRFVQDEYAGELDRNRRGIRILFQTDNGYELALANDTCFSSEQEDGGVYFPPELRAAQ